MKGSIAVVVAAVLGLGMAEKTGHAVSYDANSVKLVEATLEEAVFESDSDDAKRWEEEIREQMHYLVSQLRFLNATPGLWHSLNLNVKKVAKGTYGKTRVTYGATFLASWPRASHVKNTVQVVFPVRGDDAGMAAFEATYLARCGGHDPLWYYLQPTAPNCPLGQVQLPADAQRVTLTVKDSPLNTSNKSPEYGKMWEDGELVITHVMGNTISREERMLHANFQASFRGVTRVVTNSFFHQTTVSEQMTPAGKIVLRTMRIKTGNVQEATPEFIEEFQGYLEDTDLISYNGHAGLGKNIRAFSRMVKLVPGRYYLMWINACVPFAYFDQTLFEAAKAANPNVPWSKHLDILIATGVGYFAEMSDIRELMTGLASQRATFRQLVPRFENFSPMVLGEEDNNWPKPF